MHAYMQIEVVTFVHYFGFVLLKFSFEIAKTNWKFVCDSKGIFDTFTDFFFVVKIGNYLLID